jgi:hypothetical protein
LRKIDAQAKPLHLIIEVHISKSYAVTRITVIGEQADGVTLQQLLASRGETSAAARRVE